MFIPPKLNPQETLFMPYNKCYSILPTVYYIKMSLLLKRLLCIY